MTMLCAKSPSPERLIRWRKVYEHSLGTGLKLPIAWEIVGPDRRRSLDLLARAVMPKLA